MLGEVFDPTAEWWDDAGRRPHWAQAGVIVFGTFRTIDSVPAAVLQRWEHHKNGWLQNRGYQGHWREVVPRLSEAERHEFKREFNRTREDFLDTCHGHCVLKRPELAQIVHDALLHFDGNRYHMGDFVVMPNHVHFLTAFATPEHMRTQFDSWLHYTATQINRVIGTKGHFWQQEPFDHLVRSLEQYTTTSCSTSPITPRRRT